MYAFILKKKKKMIHIYFFFQFFQEITTNMLIRNPNYNMIRDINIFFIFI